MRFRFSIFDFRSQRTRTRSRRHGLIGVPKSNIEDRKSKIHDRGSVLVIVLVTVLFAAAALVVFTEKASDDLLVEARDITAKRLRQEAYSALEVTLAVLEDFRLVNGGLHSPAEGWSDPLGFAGWTPREGLTVEIAFEDESGKLSLPNADSAVLLNLFEEWGLAQPDAERLVDVLMNWMRKEHVTTTREPDYEQGPLPFAPPLRSLRSYSELAAIEYAREVFYDETGRPNELFGRFVSAVSLLDFKNTNLNGAVGDAVLAFGSLDRYQQQQLQDYLAGTGDRARLGPGYFQSTADAAGILGVQALPSGYGTEISALGIHVTVREGGTAFRVSTVIAPPNGAKVVEPVRDRTEESAATGESQRPAESEPANSAPQTAGTAGGAKKLKYPFTLLEIRENTEFSPAAAPESKA